MFSNREDAAHQLAVLLQGRPWRDPLVLAIPRGGVVTGAVLARALDADLDVVLARKLRAPAHPELALGAVCETGQVYLDPGAESMLPLLGDYVEQERLFQTSEIERRKKLIRSVRPAAPVAGRSVIVTDDGIATGSTMLAALKVARAQHPHELIVAVPVAARDRLAEVSRWCDETVCLLSPREFYAIGQFYRDFGQVPDERVIELLREFAGRGRPAAVRVPEPSAVPRSDLSTEPP
jgi:predicted phosphoribosyltransferase